MGNAFGHIRSVADQLLLHSLWPSPQAQGIDPGPYRSRLLAEFGNRFAPDCFTPGLAHSEVVERWLLTLQGNVGDDHAGVGRGNDIGVLLRSRFRQITVHIGMWK